MSRRLRKPSRALVSRLESAKGADWRKKRFKKQSGECAYCGVSMVLEPQGSKPLATLDHVTPTSRGGRHHWENVVCACEKCNRAKGSMTAEEFLGSLLETSHA